MNILVTGGAGFIGSNLCRRLLKNGDKITCIDNFNSFYNPEIKENNISSFKDDRNFSLIRADILNKEILKNIFENTKIDAVVHLAAMAGVRPSIQNPLLYEKVNIEGTINILECMKEAKIKKLIFASSSSVYGGNTKTPFSEEDKVDNPVSPYAATKKAGELICYTYSHLFKLDTFCLRFFTVYGPGQRPEMAIHKFTRQIFNSEKIAVYGDGSSSRDYTYIDDIIKGITASIEKVKGYEIINLGNSHPSKLIDLITLIENISGKKAELIYEDNKPGDVFTTFADIKKASDVLSFKPDTSLKEGLNKFILWYKEMRTKSSLY